MIRIGFIDRLDSSADRSTFSPIYRSHLSRFEDISKVQLPSARTILFLAADARGVDVAPIYDAAEHLIDHGVAYACAWGGDCERVHDIFDEVLVADGSRAGDKLRCPTTWHSGESLEDAVSFFLTSTVTQPLDSATSFVAVTVCNEALGEQLSRTIEASENFRENTNQLSKRPFSP